MIISTNFVPAGFDALTLGPLIEHELTQYRLGITTTEALEALT